jgi:hypothetical protein
MAAQGLITPQWGAATTANTPDLSSGITVSRANRSCFNRLARLACARVAQILEPPRLPQWHSQRRWLRTHTESSRN